VPYHLIFFLTIAGRDKLDRNLWASYERLLARISLELFTDEETRAYLSDKGITDEQMVKVILDHSERLPLLVATLAAQAPKSPEKMGDYSGKAVASFLKWVDDPYHSQVALDAALPRRLNADVLTTLVW